MAVAVRDRISTAGWAVLSGHVDHPCGKLASGQLSTCHETVEPRWDCRGSDRGEPDIGDGVPYSQLRGPDRISTAGWAALSGYFDHACGKLASRHLSTCHETVEPRWACHGSDRGEPDIGSTVSPNSQSRGPNRISTAGWAVLSGYVDHACGKSASGQLSTCHETVEPR